MRRLWIPLCVFTATFAAFLPCLRNDFVSWDDYPLLVLNPHYRGFRPEQLRWMFAGVRFNNYVPLTWLSFAADYSLWGMKPFGYHLTNLLLHSLNAVLFYFLAKRLLATGTHENEPPLALELSAGLAALLFSIHPLRVESVAWAVERRDVLSGAFYLGTLLAYLRWAAGPQAGRRRWYWISVALFGLSLLSKGIGVSLPLLLLILDAYPLRRTAWREKIPYFLLAAATGLIGLFGQADPEIMRPLTGYGAGPRLAQTCYSLCFYLWKTAQPSRLWPIYELPARIDLGSSPYVWCAAAVIVVTALLWAARRRFPAPLAAWCAYVAALLPVSGPVQFGRQIAADRYTYLACMSWALLAGAIIRRLLIGRKQPLGFAAVLFAALLPVGALTWRQTLYWRDSDSLWRHVLAMDPHNSTGHKGLGDLLRERGLRDEALGHFQQAVASDPNSWGAQNDLGLALAESHDLAGAVAHYEEALRIVPNSAVTHNNLGTALGDEGNVDGAIMHFQEALRVKPDYVEAHANLGMALARRGRVREGMDELAAALLLDPACGEAHNNMGLLLAGQNRWEEAIAHYQAALKVLPNHPVILANLRKSLAARRAP
ncbi:MAG: tetratricopeptide repeat protein [Elusimicrobiota bacterium]